MALPAWASRLLRWVLFQEYKYNRQLGAVSPSWIAQQQRLQGRIIFEWPTCEKQRRALRRIGRGRS
jgi:hypothetical protein